MWRAVSLKEPSGGDWEEGEEPYSDEGPTRLRRARREAPQARARRCTTIEPHNQCGCARDRMRSKDRNAQFVQEGEMRQDVTPKDAHGELMAGKIVAG